MSFEFDSKGKIFTDVVSKVSVSAQVQTTLHLIRGTLHIRLGERVKDELDRDELFLAITDATVLAADGTVLQQTPFIAVRRAQIVWIIPASENQEA
jgi:hypothetical protein